MRDFHSLKVWEKAHMLTLQVYRATKNFPDDERYGLTSQVRRSCTSIPINIAEGCGYDSRAELAHYLQISMGSSSELEYQLFLAHDLNYLSDDVFQELNRNLNEIRRMLNVYIHKIRSDLNKPVNQS